MVPEDGLEPSLPKKMDFENPTENNPLLDDFSYK